MEVERPITRDMVDLDLGADLPLDCGADALNRRVQPKSCKAATLSAWIALLSFILVIFYAGMKVLDTIIEDDRFWDRSDQLLEAFLSARARASGGEAAVPPSSDEES